MFRLPPGHGAQKLEQIAGLKARIERARRGGGPVPNASRQAGSPGLTSAPDGATPGLGGTIPQALGRFQVFTAAGRAITVEPRVVELDRLVPSHGPDGTANPAYPHAKGLQPRDRGAEGLDAEA